MSKPDSIVLEDPDLKACRQKAAQILGIQSHEIEITILQQGKRGLFRNTPFRIRASKKKDKNEPRREQDLTKEEKLANRIETLNEELNKLNLSTAENQQKVFDEMLQNYDSLSSELKEEVKELADLLTGNEAKAIHSRISSDSSFTIHVAKDNLKALININPPEGNGAPLKLHQVLDGLRTAGITQGIDHVKIRKVLEDVIEINRPINNVEVVCGRLPVNGQDGSVEYFVGQTTKEILVRDDGSMDYRGKAKISVVNKGDIIARIIPAGAGEPGVDVYGREIPARSGAPANVQAGANVSIDIEKQEIVAEIDGVVETRDSVISIRPVYIVNGDVDMTVGNIDFKGAVQILGTVRSGFHVNATGNIDIAGSIEGAEVVSRQGSINVAKGIAGHDNCFVSAAEDITAKYIENARVYSLGNVTVHSAILHSKVTAGDSVSVMQSRGAIIGGEIRAGELVRAKQVGAEAEPYTLVIVGIEVDDYEHIANLDQRIISLQHIALKLKELISILKDSAKNLKQLPYKKREQLKDYQMKLFVVNREIEKLNQERNNYLDELTNQTKGSVRIAKMVYAHVEIQIGKLVETVRIPLSSVTFAPDADATKIVQQPYS